MNLDSPGGYRLRTAVLVAVLGAAVVLVPNMAMAATWCGTWLEAASRSTPTRTSRSMTSGAPTGPTCRRTPYVCLSVPDRTSSTGTSRDTNQAAGDFQVDGLDLGTYRLQETAAPPGYDPVNPNPLPTIVVTSTALFPPEAAPIQFANNPRMKIIVLPCNTVTETPVDATVGLDSDLDPGTALEQKATLAAAPSCATDAQLCGLAGASYDTLRWGTYGGSVEVPDVAPAFP